MATDLEKIRNFSASYQVDDNPAVHGYKFEGDAIAAITAVGYFNAVRDNNNPLKIGHLINLKGSDGDGLYKVTVVSPDVELIEIGGGSSGPVSLANGSLHLVSATPVSVTIPAPLIVGPATTALIFGNNFDSPAVGQLRYIGPPLANFHLSAAASLKASASSDGNLIELTFALNGVDLGVLSRQSGVLPLNNQSLNVALFSSFPLTTNDIVEVFISNLNGANALTPVSLNLNIIQAT